MSLLSWRSLRPVVASSLLAALLSACGGGGGDAGTGGSGAVQGPPATEAPMSQSSNDASGATAATVSVGASIAARDSSVGSILNPFGGATAGSQRESAAWLGKSAASASGREQPTAIETLACTDLFAPPCSGSLTLDTNAEYGASIPAGSYFTLSTGGVTFVDAGHTYNLSGSLRVDFVSAFDPDATSVAGLSFVLTSNLGGSIDGKVFAPENVAARFDFDNLGTATITTEGRTFSHLSGISVTDADNYVIGSATVKAAHWSSASGYVTSTFDGWNVADGRPMVGSAVAITGAGGGSVAIAVLSSSTSTVVYDVTITVGSAVKRYTVTATYSSGVATYAAVEIAA